MAESDVSRRRVLIGAAWTAPVVLVATSAPARATSNPDVVAPPNTLIFNNVTVSNGTNGTVDANLGIQLAWTAGYPAGVTATVFYQSTAVGPAPLTNSYSTVVGSQPIGNAESVTADLELTGVPVGDYQVTTIAWATAVGGDGTTYRADATPNIQSFTVTS